MPRQYRGNRAMWSGSRPGAYGRSGPMRLVSGQGPGTQTRDLEPAPTGWRALSAPERDPLLAAAMDRGLRSLLHPVDTRALAQALAYELDALGFEAEIARWLTGVAPLVPEASRNEAKSFTNAHGTVCLPWMWSPRLAEGQLQAQDAPEAIPAPEPLAWGSPQRMAELDAEFAAEDFTNADERSAMRLGFPSVAAMLDQAKLDELLAEPDSE